MGGMAVLTSASRAKQDLAGIPGLEPQGGDTKLIWDKDRPGEVDAARTVFDKLVGSKGRGYSAFRTDDQGQPGQRLDQFDPDVEAMVLTPPMRAG